jgi:hypothetical protein
VFICIRLAACPSRCTVLVPAKVQQRKFWLVMEGVMECVGGEILSGILGALKGLFFETLALRPDPLVRSLALVDGCLL